MENNMVLLLLSMCFIIIGSNILKEILSYPIMFCMYLMVVILALIIIVLHKGEFKKATNSKQTCLDAYFKKAKK